MSEPATLPTDSPAPSFWKRRVVDPIVHQLTQGITPEKVALTLAVGSACALFPIVGTTTFLCFVIGIALRLNQPIIQLVNGMCVPIHIPAVLGLIRAGEWMFREPKTNLNIRYLNHTFWGDPGLFLHRYSTIALHAVVAWAAVLPIWIPLVYFIFLPVLRELQNIRLAAVATADRSPPANPAP